MITVSGYALRWGHELSPGVIAVRGKTKITLTQPYVEDDIGILVSFEVEDDWILNQVPGLTVDLKIINEGEPQCPSESRILQNGRPESPDSNGRATPS